MKNAFYILLLAIILACQKEKEAVNDTKLTYTEYKSYSIKNPQLIAQEDFLIINDSATFNSIFDLSIVTDNKISSDIFKTKVVISVIKEFKDVCSCPTIDLDTLFVKDEKVIFKYSIADLDNSSDSIICTGICYKNIIISINAEAFSSIDFYENDMLKKTLYK